MKRRMFFIATIVMGMIIFQGIYIAKECATKQKTRHITESLKEHQELSNYVDEMVEFPTEASQKPLAKMFLLAFLQIASKRKEAIIHYIATIKSLYYYMLGSLLSTIETVLHFVRRT
jgi:hypothetical protein